MFFVLNLRLKLCQWLTELQDLKTKTAANPQINSCFLAFFLKSPPSGD